MEQAIENITKFHNKNCIDRPGYAIITATIGCEGSFASEHGVFEELGVFFPHEVGSLKTWSEVNKLKQDAFYEENTQRRQESREKLHK